MHPGPIRCKSRCVGDTVHFHHRLCSVLKGRQHFRVRAFRSRLFLHCVRIGVEAHRVVFAFSEGYDLKPDRVCKIVQLHDRGRLVPGRTGVHNPGTLRQLVQNGPDSDVRLHIQHDDVLAVLNGVVSDLRPDFRHARRINHHVDHWKIEHDVCVLCCDPAPFLYCR